MDDSPCLMSLSFPIPFKQHSHNVYTDLYNISFHTSFIPSSLKMKGGGVWKNFLLLFFCRFFKCRITALYTWAVSKLFGPLSLRTSMHKVPFLCDQGSGSVLPQWMLYVLLGSGDQQSDQLLTQKHFTRSTIWVVLKLSKNCAGNNNSYKPISHFPVWHFKNQEKAVFLCYMYSCAWWFLKYVGEKKRNTHW